MPNKNNNNETNNDRKSNDKLPMAIGLLGTAAIFNVVQTYVPHMRDTFIPRMFIMDQGTHLAARMFGNWTALAALIRVYASMNIHSKPLYQLCMWTFVGAFTVFSLETFVYGTSYLKSPGVWPPMVLSSTMLFWMILKYNYYVGSSSSLPDGEDHNEKKKN